jgi:hypothetical protein
MPNNQFLMLVTPRILWQESTMLKREDRSSPP